MLSKTGKNKRENLKKNLKKCKGNLEILHVYYFPKEKFERDANMEENHTGSGWKNNKHKKIIGAMAIAVFLILSAAVCWFVGRPLLAFVSEPGEFQAWVDAHGIWGRLAFIGMMALQIIIAVIPGEPLEIGAGYAFGTWEGTILCLVGAIVGSVIVFLFVRYFGIKIVEVFFSVEKIRSLKFLQNTKRLNLLVAILFFIPGTPKDLLSYFIGLTKMKLSTWILITGLARIPSVITSTIGGEALGMQNYQFAIAVFAATLIISGAGLLIYRKICQKEEGKAIKATQNK